MNRIVAALALTLAAACSGADTATEAEAPLTAEVTEPDLYAVLTYADWCSSCKELEPKLDTVRTENELDGIKFVRIDYTGRDQEAFFEDAADLNVGPAIDQRFGEEIFTGLLVLVDADGETILGEINRRMSEEEILAAFRSAQEQAAG